MNAIMPEFHRPIEIARIANTGSHERISAEPAECVALAHRLKLPALHSVSARLVVKPWSGGGYKVSGEVTVDVEQTSVISLEVFRSTVSFPLERYFLKKPRVSEDGDAEDDADVITGGIIDLGEIAAETIGLELDPYPRKPGEIFDTPAEETSAIAKITPFSALKRDKES